MNRQIRKVVRVGTSIAVTLPKTWADAMDVRLGDEVELVWNGEILVRKCEVVRGEG